MKQTNAFKKIFLASLIGACGAVNAQNTTHPLAFAGTVPSAGDTVNNFYKDYIGLRLDVTQPAVVAGDKFYTAATVPEGWGAITLTTFPIVNDTVIMPQTGDSCACNPITTVMTNKIALVWRGPESGACEFGAKALAAQTAGAKACVIINEYAGQGPVGMAPGASGASVHIPVYMIGNLDGIALTQQYESGGLGSVKMTITPWGLELNNDLGFVPGGTGIWHDYAIPYTQLNGSEAPSMAYRSVSGAFVANYGNNNANGVVLTDTLFWTPTGGSASRVYSDSTKLASFPVSDSIWAMYGNEHPSLGSVTSTGQFTVNYHITSDSSDQFAFNNDLSYSFYATDSLFSKGRYDMVNNIPIITQWFEPDANNYLWGTPYYVSQGGSAAKAVQVSVSGGPGLLPNGAAVNIFIFKWVDGSYGTGSLDSAIETGELTLVGGGCHTFDGVADSSFDIFNVNIWVNDSACDSSALGSWVHPKLDSQAWYLVTADVEGSSLALGCDGILDAYPRTYFRYHTTGYREMYNPLVDTDFLDLRGTYQAASWSSYAFPGESAADNAANRSYAQNASFPIDSIFYNGQIGLIPALPMMITPYVADTTPINNGVKAVSQAGGSLKVYPNPASSYVTVSVTLSDMAKVVSYKILDNFGRIVAKEVHNNVTSEEYTFNTSSLAAGNYTMVVFADDKMMFKKFAVVNK